MKQRIALLFGLATNQADVATLARDAKFLAKAGYQPVTIQPIDARPQTYHVETVPLWQFPDNARHRA